MVRTPTDKERRTYNLDYNNEEERHVVENFEQPLEKKLSLPVRPNNHGAQ